MHETPNNFHISIALTGSLCIGDTVAYCRSDATLAVPNIVTHTRSMQQHRSIPPGMQLPGHLSTSSGRYSASGSVLTAAPLVMNQGLTELDPPASRHARTRHTAPAFCRVPEVPSTTLLHLSSHHVNPPVPCTNPHSFISQVHGS